MTVILPKRPARFRTVSATTRRTATIALLAIGVRVLAPAALDAQNITCEPGDIEVRGLEFRGNVALDDDDLALRVTTTPSSWGRRTLRLPFGRKRCLDRQELGNDLLRLKAYYRDRGFYAAHADTLVAPAGDDAVRVTFTITEGEPTVLDAYTVTGLDSVAEGPDLLARLQLKVGRPFDILLWGADMDTIVRRLRDAGYYRAQTVPGYDADSVDRRARAFITVVPGRRARFGPTEIEVRPVSAERGQQIDSSTVRRVLGIAPGTFYSDRAIVEAQRNLFQLGTYLHIDVAPLPDSLQPPGDTTVVLLAQLSEDYMRQLDSEFGWGTLDCGRMRLQFTDRNFLRQARRLELTGQASKLGYGDPVQTQSTRDACTFNGQSPLAEDSMSSKLYYFAGASVRQPRLLGRRLQPTLSLYSERRGEYKAYLRSTLVGADISATQEIGRRMPLRLGYTFEWGRTRGDPPALCALFNRCDEASRRQLDTLATLGVASANLSRVRTDNAISPTRGTLMRAELRSSATSLLLTDPSLFFNKATGDVAWYRLVAQNVLAVRLRAGVVRGRRLNPTDPEPFIPPQERLYAGGAASVRGFQQNELGSAVYIARNSDVLETRTGTAPNDTLEVSIRPNSATFQTDTNPDRAVPLGGNALFVANFEYRIRDPFFFPDRLQYSVFIDGGDVWSQGRAKLKWTPGLGVRALTPVGPVQVNVGWNRYDREAGPLYYNPNVELLACVSPGTPHVFTRDPVTGRFNTAGDCDPFRPPERKRWYQQLTFTFSIGPDF